MVEEKAERLLLVEFFPVSAKRVNRLELFVPVQTESKLAGGVLSNAIGHVLQTFGITIDVAVDFNFKMKKTVSFDALVKRLRKAVIDLVFNRNLRSI